MTCFRYDLKRAQTMMEYLLVMVVIVLIVFVAFKKEGGGVLEKTHAKTANYFDTGAAAIMGGYYNGSYVKQDPLPIHGAWCAWTSCVNGVQVRECACPRPAFGGDPCAGDALKSCSK